MRAGGDCCPQPMCRNPDGSTINPLTSPGSQYPVYGTYPGGFTGFRPGYTQPFATGSNSFTSQSSKWTIVSVSSFKTRKSFDHFLTQVKTIILDTCTCIKYVWQNHDYFSVVTDVLCYMNIIVYNLHSQFNITTWTYLKDC